MASIDQFAKELSPVSDWYSLGVFLGAPVNDLDTIRNEYSKFGVTRCLIELYKCLETLGKTPSWSVIVERLRSLGNYGLADKIHSTYIQPSLEPPVKSNSNQQQIQSTEHIERPITDTSGKEKLTQLELPPLENGEKSAIEIQQKKLNCI